MNLHSLSLLVPFIPELSNQLRIYSLTLEILLHLMVCNIQINIICLINLDLSIPSTSGLCNDEQRLTLKYCLRGFMNNDPISIGTVQHTYN